MPTIVSVYAYETEIDSYSRCRCVVVGVWNFREGFKGGGGKLRQAKNCNLAPSQIFFKFFTLSEPGDASLTRVETSWEGVGMFLVCVTPL